MANFEGTRDSNVALSVDNQSRKVLILDTITRFDSTVGNFESAEGLFDLGGTDSTSNPTNFEGNIQSSGFYTFSNTLSLDDIYDVSLGAILGMSAEDEYDLHDSGRGATLHDDAKGPYDGSSEINCGAEIQVGADNTSLANISSFQKIAQQSTIKGRFFKFRCKIISDNNKVRAKVHDLKFSVNFEKRVESGEDITSSASGTIITFTNGFFATPSIGIAGQGMQTGDYFSITSKSKTGFTIQFFNASNTGISRIFDFQAVGHGLKST
tara:strand:- start:1107 stop:1907 length:801 start_codon:yes stop_codon:yes gene_type:complete